MKYFSLFLLSFFLLLMISCSSTKKATKSEPVYISSPTGLKYLDLNVGNGVTPKNGQKVFVNYIIKTEDGKEIENTFSKNKPDNFRLGSDDIIKGMNEGITGMKVGGKRKVIIPPELGFGERSVRNIPSGSNLIMEIELLKVE